MNLRTLLVPFDLYERHAVVGRLLSKTLGPANGRGDLRVLDVGGHTGGLAEFVPYRVVALNVDGKGDLSYDGFAIPLADGSFDAVTCIDTIEHMPKLVRTAFLKECLRVARQCLIVAAPFGSAEHIVHEEFLSSLYQAARGEPHRYLEEHIRFGLPDGAELKQIVETLGGMSASLYFAGDFYKQGRYFARAISRPGEKGLFNNIRRICTHAASLKLLRRVRLLRQPTGSTNRFYLLLTRNG